METTDTRFVRLIVLVALLTSGATGWSNLSAVQGPAHRRCLSN